MWGRHPEAVARILLRDHLTKEQWRTYRELGYFDVTGSDGGTYRINAATEANVLAPSGRHLWVSSIERLPLPDVLLSQKLFLETDAPGYRRESCG